ncbi:MAG: hypothetical protein MAGBODY4_00947 [Candidatus Marinimicrobia bacterium]|nr:hypothetical protein [Candidatus Neomarinimicrobiota bacterium]
MIEFSWLLYGIANQIILIMFMRSEQPVKIIIVCFCSVVRNVIDGLGFEVTRSAKIPVLLMPFDLPLEIKGIDVSFSHRSPLFPELKGNIRGVDGFPGVQVDVICNQKFSRAHRGTAGFGVEFRRTEVGLPPGIL